ncbi:MAG: hypothetical protein SOT71_13820 [Romboutsia timonensis]|uniref:hypothetical protein n=1 Tax=Romboutsia timonensis TaxID=1776391 RepID=UPI002A748276|nr:hypothetical protein [Romboutsia timonensis]MDY2883723.1 hypothetical protein [Romboutsia timonensis]
MKLTNEMIELAKITLLKTFKNKGIDSNDVEVFVDNVALGNDRVSHLLAHCIRRDVAVVSSSLALLDYRNNLIVIDPNSPNGYTTNDLVDFITILPNGKLKFDVSCIDKNIACPGLMFDMNDFVVDEKYLELLRREFI